MGDGEKKQIHIGYEIEPSIRNSVNNSLVRCTIEDVEGSLNKLRCAFEALGKSSSGRGRGSQWAYDLIQAYRSVGEVLQDTISKYTEDPKLEESPERFTIYKELLKEFEGDDEDSRIINLFGYLIATKEGHKKLLEYYNGRDNPLHQISEALGDLDQIREILKNNNLSLDNFGALEHILSLSDAIEGVSELEKL